MWSALLPTICPVYLCVNVGPQGATCRSACPILCHSESGPLSFLRECGAAESASGQTACAILSNTPPVSVPPQQRESSPPRVPISTPPTGLDECLFFYLLGVGLPCHSIFCQFQLWEEAQCVYLRLHLGSLKSRVFNICQLKHKDGKRLVCKGHVQMHMNCGIDLVSVTTAKSFM